ncbi:hypothetical protein D8S93_23555 [Vibrio sp. VGrn 2]|uniref:fimbria/pilus outer membrane usher protein n=1 Tax=Vibrio sp. VGrn 2 TaxID=2419839 RepID=UPI00128E3824|nr:fimbria/pilus outer membrane usher protein [Vibrio sp. VGrn 2]MPS41558.1 hypothetical protein [Vibrio sp. VGrn 2]
MKITTTTVLTLSIVAWGSHAEYDLSFVKDRKAAELLLSGKVPSGQYLVDVKFNNRDFGRDTILVQQPTDKDNLCLPKGLASRLNINLDKINHTYDSQFDCYNITQLESASISLNLQSMTLSVSVPQVYLNEEHQLESWDYGETAAVLNYYARTNKGWGGNNSHSSYANFDARLNYDRWVLKSNFDLTSGKGLNTPEFTLSTAVEELKADLELGKTTTRSQYTPDFSFRGATLRSNRAMKNSHYRVYAPTVSGVLSQISTVTIKQGERVLYSQTLPPGEYVINDYNITNNGEVDIIIEGSDGSVKYEKLHVSLVPGLLKEGDKEFNVSVGEREQDLSGLFGFGEFNYGFEAGTLSANALVHSKYNNFGLGYALPMGQFGAISSSINLSSATYDKGSFQPNFEKTQKGLSFSFKYAKDISESTNLQLLTYQYQDEGYVDFHEFEPENSHQNNQRRSRYEASLRHKIGDSYLTSSLWLQDYRDNRSSESGASVLLSKTFQNNVGISIQGYYQKNQFDENYGTSVGVNIPFDLWDQPQFSTTTVSYDNNNNASLSTAVSIRPNDNVSYQLSSTIANEGEITANASTNIKTSVARLGMGISTARSNTAAYANVSGSFIAADNAGLAWGPDRVNTIAIAHADSLKGITFNRGMSDTNVFGNALIPLTDYRSNEVYLNTSKVPLNTEFLNGSKSLYPTENSVHVLNFDYLDIKRYILKVKDKNQNYLDSGIVMKDEEGAIVGTTTTSGVLIATVLNDSSKLLSDHCVIDLSNLESGENVIHEVQCN